MQEMSLNDVRTNEIYTIQAAEIKTFMNTGECRQLCMITWRHAGEFVFPSVQMAFSTLCSVR